jgi:hypothetical protein
MPAEGSTRLIDDFYLIGVVEEDGRKVPRCVAHSAEKSLAQSIPLFCVPDVETQVLQKTYARSAA